MFKCTIHYRPVIISWKWLICTIYRNQYSTCIDCLSTQVYLKIKSDVKISHNTKFYFLNTHLWEETTFNLIFPESFNTVVNVIFKETSLLHIHQIQIVKNTYMDSIRLCIDNHFLQTLLFSSIAKIIIMTKESHNSSFNFILLINI